MTQLNWANNFIESLVKNRFTGTVEINFYQGGFTNINKKESFKPPQDKEED